MKKLVTLLSSICLSLAVYAGSGKVADISHADLQAAISKKAVTVLDVNGSDSFAEGRIPGAIDFSANGKKLAALLPKDKNALIVAIVAMSTATPIRRRPARRSHSATPT